MILSPLCSPCAENTAFIIWFLWGTKGSWAGTQTPPGTQDGLRPPCCVAMRRGLVNRGYFGGAEAKPTLGANRDIPAWCRSTHLWRDASAFSVHPLEKKSAARSIHASSPSPTARKARNSWLGWQSGTFLPVPAARSGRRDKNTLSVPRSLPVATRLCPPASRRGCNAGRHHHPPLGSARRGGQQMEGVLHPFSLFLTPLLLRKTVVLSGKPPSNRGCGALGCV